MRPYNFVFFRRKLMKEKIFLHDLHIKRIFIFIFLFIYLALNIKFEAQAVQAHWTYWNEFDYSNGNLIADGYYSYYNDRSSTAAIRTSAVPMTVTINGKEYPQSIQEIANAAGITSSSTRGNYDVTLNYDGFSIEITTLCAMSTRQMQFRDGDMFDISVIIPKGSNINVGNGDIRYYGFRNDTDAGSSAVKFTANVNDKLNHIKSCNGGSMQHDANQHWQICNTCGYTKIKKTNHAFTTTKAATCTADGSKKCSTCGRTATISKLGHNWSTSWTSDNSKHWHKCTRCSATKDSASHTWTYSNINAQTHDKKCNVCGKTITKEAHSFVNNKCACGRYNTVKVSFDLNKPAESTLVNPNPSSINQITYTYGDKYYDSKYGLVNPTLQDYTFEGWYTAKTGGTKVDTGTAVSNSNAHTLYAHWKEANLPITSIKLNNKQVIEYLKDTTESQYRSKYKPDANIPYANVDISANITKPSGKYVYTWECYKDGKWQSINLSEITVTDTALNIKNATRNLNGLKFRLSVKGNNSKVVTSNEATLTVWWLPNAQEQTFEVFGD